MGIRDWIAPVSRNRSRSHGKGQKVKGFKAADLELTGKDCCPKCGKDFSSNKKKFLPHYLAQHVK